MMLRTKAFRRHKMQVAKQKAKRLIKTIWSPGSVHDAISNPRVVGMYAATPKPCSCPMCCNPRNKKSWEKDKRTMQEKKAEEK